MLNVDHIVVSNYRGLRHLIIAGAVSFVSAGTFEIPEIFGIKSGDGHMKVRRG